MALRLYNTLTCRKERFEPIRDNVVRMFVCGPTVYDSVHLGHARTYIFYDILARFLISQGYQVFFVVNLTDIDEKVFDRSEKEGIPYNVLAERHIKEFLQDLESLRVDKITLFARASDYVQEASNQVSLLIKKGYAYDVDGHVFFDSTHFPNFGKLSHQSQLELKLRRINPDPMKHNQTDFLLWTVSRTTEPSWVGPVGKGRPGWHIEDTAISISLLGTRYDIHGGAIDLIYPHHESEIAQAEALTGESPFVRYWVHTNLLNLHGKKMSKSVGNSISIRQAVTTHGTNTLRLYFALHQYRRKMNFDEAGLKDAKAKLKVLSRTAFRLEELSPVVRGNLREDEKSSKRRWIRYEKEIIDALNDDLNTPRAIESLVIWSTEMDETFSKESSRELLLEMRKRFQKILWIIGLDATPRPETVLSFTEGSTPRTYD